MARSVDKTTDSTDQDRNVWRHVIALTSSKSAAGLIDPKLVLSWLLTTLAWARSGSVHWCLCARRERCCRSC
jgi:hypothetical protein